MTSTTWTGRRLSILPEREAIVELFREAMPIIGMTVSRLAMQTIDFVMVSQLGTAAQAAISPTTFLVFAVSCIGLGAVTSVQTYVAQACGRGESRVGGSYAWQALYIAAFFGLITWPIATNTSTWYGWWSSAVNTPPEVAELQTIYIQWCLWQTMPAVLAQGLQSFYNGVKRSTIPLIATIASLVTNVVGNYLLIWGKFGFPEMGIAGAALATVIGWWVRVAVMFVPMFWASNEREFGTASSMSFNFGRTVELLKLGIPTGLTWMLDLGSWVVFLNAILPPYGTAVMAASAIAMQYMHLSFMPAIGIGTAVCTQVGFAIGAGKPEHATKRTYVGMWLNGVYMTLIGVVMLAFSGPLIRLFNADPDVIHQGRMILIWVALFQLGDAMCITYLSALRGAGDAKVPAIMMFVCCWGIFIGGGIAASRLLPEFGMNVPWATCTIYIVVLGALSMLRWNSGVWRSIKLAGAGPAVREADSEQSLVERLESASSAVDGARS